MAKVSAAGRRVQAEWAANVAAAARGEINPEYPKYVVDYAHEDARRMDRAMAEKVRKAERKAARAAKAEAKVAAVAAALAEGTMGECQICARRIGTTVGVIAHHGYERPGDGYQTPSCAGARYPSYAESCDRLREVASNTAVEAAAAERAAADIAANPPESLIYERQTERWIGKRRETVRETVTRPEGFVDTPVVTWLQSERYSYRVVLRDQRARMARRAAAIREAATFLARRLAAWVPPAGR